MDIARLSMNLSVADTAATAGIAMLDKTMDVNEILGQGLVDMIDTAAIERSISPHIGGNFDIRI